MEDFNDNISTSNEEKVYSKDTSASMNSSTSKEQDSTLSELESHNAAGSLENMK